MRRVWLLALLLLASCEPESPLGGVAAGFRVDVARLEFGRALEGTQVARELILYSTGRVPLTVEASASEPFSVVSSIEVPGGSQVALTVSFTAGSTRAAGSLELTANDKRVFVTLEGQGVRPLPCLASAPCQVARFDLASGACIESRAADGAACAPDSDCLENGRCRAGACIGTTRSCNDQNRCTADACSPGLGCVNAPVSCPSSTSPCKVPSCDPVLGCGEENAADGTPCGAIDCVTANLCVSGACLQVPTPDGFVCSPRTPCQEEGRCHSQRCERPDAGELVPDWWVPLSQGPGPEAELLASEGNLYFQGCDGGCALVSYTGSGFARFSAAHPDPAPRRLLAASGNAVVLLANSRIEARSASSGGPVWSLPFASLSPPPEASGAQAVCSRERFALSSGGEVIGTFSWSAPDGGALLPGVQTLLRVEVDGGFFEQLARDAGTSSLVALGPGEVLTLYDPAGALFRVGLPWDGGSSLQQLGDFPGLASLALSSQAILAGATHLLIPDGGARPMKALDGGTLQLMNAPVLLGPDRGYAFSRVCVAPFGPPCLPEVEASFLHAFSLVDGQPLWESQILPEGVPGRLAEAALVQGGGVATLTQVALSGGLAAHIQLFGEGKRLFVCPLPGNPLLGPAAFDRGQLYVVVERAGAWTLEAYRLANLPLESTGWPQRNGLSGSRRGR